MASNRVSLVLNTPPALEGHGRNSGLYIGLFCKAMHTGENAFPAFQQPYGFLVIWCANAS